MHRFYRNIESAKKFENTTKFLVLFKKTGLKQNKNQKKGGDLNT